MPELPASRRLSANPRLTMPRYVLGGLVHEYGLAADSEGPEVRSRWELISALETTKGAPT
jgi:hypothetical protein